jgi:hypothetical protein
VGGRLLLDHAIVLVRELEAAEDLLLQAGFVLGRAGFHPGLGTRNRLVLLPRGPYLELLAVQQPGPANAAYQALLMGAHCVLGLALASGDIQASALRLSRAGVEAGLPIQACRPLPTDDGREGRQARFSLLPLPIGALGAGFAFHCQHHTPQWVWEPAPDHVNGARALRALALGAGCVAEPWTDMAPPAGTRADWVRLLQATAGSAALHFHPHGSLHCTPTGLQWRREA